MTLDPATLNVAFVLLSIVLGALLVFAWRLNQRVKALAWWGAAFCLVACGIGAVNIGRASASYSALFAGNALVLLAYAALYAGCRAFNARKGFSPFLLTGVALWAAAFPFIYDSHGSRLVLLAATVGAYSLFSAWELWRHAAQTLASQRVAIILLIGLGIFNLARGWLGISLTSIAWIDALANRWSSQMALLLVVYTPTLAFIFLSMAKESVELGYKQAAFIDPLTGIPNRRAFLQHATRLIRTRADKPVSCLIFDLDNFKAVNDRYGHEMGDHVLTLFGEVLTQYLPEHSFGRLGGEEFGAILPLSRQEAADLAETIRHAFSKTGRAVLGPQTDMTVSVGCASSPRSTIKTLLQEADAALYKAKGQGRNIVMLA